MTMASWKLRPLEERDWQGVLAAANAAVPWNPGGNEEWLRARRLFDTGSGRRARWVAEAPSGEVVAFGSIEEGPQPADFRLFLVMGDELLQRGLGEALYQRLHYELLAAGARSAWVREEARSEELLRFLRGRGLVEVRRDPMPDLGTVVVLRLDLPSD